MTIKKVSRPNLGFGLGLRPEHYETILSQNLPIDWFEVLTENYLVPGGKPLYYLNKICERYPIAMHGVSLSIGSVDPLDFAYLAQVKELADRIHPQWISDHLCWTGVNDLNMHDLLPLPYTEEAILHVVSKIQQVQDFLNRRILIENVSSYITYQHSEMSEWDFLSEITRRADCLILLDINNIYVSSVNHHFKALDYLKKIPTERVYQMHLAGHSDHGSYIIDTHDAAIVSPVWELYSQAIKLTGPVSTIIERDDNIPPLEELVTELNLARQVSASVVEEINDCLI